MAGFDAPSGTSRLVVASSDNLTQGAVRGLNTSELARQVARRLPRQYVKNPNVAAEVTSYRLFCILGQVPKPGQNPYAHGVTVENAVSIAPGYKPRAKKRFLRLTRKFGGFISTVMVPTDDPIQSGDTIYVLRRLL